MFDLVGKRKWYLIVSALVIVPGVIGLILFWFNVGIDFSSGHVVTLVFRKQVETAELRHAFAGLDHEEAVIQHSPKQAYLVRLEEFGDEDREKLLEGLEPELGGVRIAELGSASQVIALMFTEEVAEEALTQKLDALGYGGAAIEDKKLDSFLVRTRFLTPAEEEEINKELQEQFGALDSLDFYEVSPAIAVERVRYTMYAVAVAAVGILAYISWAFRRLPRPFRYGVCAIIALIHDVLVVMGLFAIFRIEVNSMFIIGVLTVIGYSVNDTIVVFDRIRENLLRYPPGSDFAFVVNSSLTQTLGRSLNTSLTTLFVLLALLLFGGPTISNFILALIIGVISGTYSSICIASQVLVLWEQGHIGRLLRRLPLSQPAGRGGR